MSRVLVVDDSALIRNMVSTILQELGLETELAENGEVAMNIFAQQEFDLVVTDVIMPEVDGIELVRQIRAINTEVPILVVTSAAHPRYQESSQKAGANGFLLKPIDSDLLQNAVRKLLPALSEAK